MANNWTYGSEIDLTNGGADDLTAVDILTSLPSGLLEVEISLHFASLDADNTSYILQLGDSGGYHTSGYQSASTTGNTASGNFTDGVTNVLNTSNDSADTMYGTYRLYRFAEAQHKWIVEFSGAEPTVGVRYSFGSVTLDTELTQIRITTPAGTAAFDNGLIIGRYR